MVINGIRQNYSSLFIFVVKMSSMSEFNYDVIMFVLQQETDKEGAMPSETAEKQEKLHCEAAERGCC